MSGWQKLSHRISMLSIAQKVCPASLLLMVAVKSQSGTSLDGPCWTRLQSHVPTKGPSFTRHIPRHSRDLGAIQRRPNTIGGFRKSVILRVIWQRISVDAVARTMIELPCLLCLSDELKREQFGDLQCCFPMPPMPFFVNP
jgi:hypothetical protein